jgi:hypothetical protein
MACLILAFGAGGAPIGTPAQVPDLPVDSGPGLSGAVPQAVSARQHARIRGGLSQLWTAVEIGTAEVS